MGSLSGSIWITLFSPEAELEAIDKYPEFDIQRKI